MKYLDLATRIFQSGANDLWFCRKYDSTKLARERAVAVAKAREVVPVDDENEDDYQWDGSKLNVGNVDAGMAGRDHPSNIIHEIAHWAVCTSRARRSSPDYGLGSGPDSRPGLDVVMNERDTQLEEERASMLGVLMEFELGFPAADTLRLHSWAHPWTPHDGNKPAIPAPDGKWTYDRAAGWTLALNWLVRRGLISPEGEVNWAQVSKGSADR